MKIFSYSVFRALCAIAVGALLVQYREQMVTWMTMLIGVLFFLSGLMAVVMSLARRRANASLLLEQRPGCSGGAIMAGIGSMLLGAALALMPDTFVEFLVLILSAFLILGALQQFFTLGTARSLGAVGFGWWLPTLLLFGAGCVALFKPSLIASFPLLFIGCSMIVYGVVECLNALKARSCRKHAEARAASGGKPDFSNAEVVDFEEVSAEL